MAALATPTWLGSVRRGLATGHGRADRGPRAGDRSAHR